MRMILSSQLTSFYEMVITLSFNFLLTPQVEDLNTEFDDRQSEQQANQEEEQRRQISMVKQVSELV